MHGPRAVPQRRRLPFVQNFALLLSIFNPNPEICARGGDGLWCMGDNVVRWFLGMRQQLQS